MLRGVKGFQVVDTGGNAVDRTLRSVYRASSFTEGKLWACGDAWFTSPSTSPCCAHYARRRPDDVHFAHRDVLTAPPRRRCWKATGLRVGSKSRQLTGGDV